MNFFSDTREAERRFGDYIEDLHDVFRCHRVDYGSAQDFVVFARAVRHHGELRDDVMRVVTSLRADEADVSFRTILTIIAVASGGPEVAMSEWEMSVPVQNVVESLNNADIGSQDNAEPTDPVSINPSIDSHDLEASNDPVVSGADPGHLDSGYSDTLAESLTRLELNSLQLKTYLDSIEQRIARIEPRSKDIPSPIVPVPPIGSPDEPETGYLASVLTESEPRRPHNNHPISDFVTES